MLVRKEKLHSHPQSSTHTRLFNSKNPFSFWATLLSYEEKPQTPPTLRPSFLPSFLSVENYALEFHSFMASKFWVNWSIFFFLFLLGFAIKILAFSKKMATRVALKLIRQSVFNVRRKPNFIPRHHYCANAGPPPPPPPPKIAHSSRKVSINNMLHTFYCALFFINYMSNFWVMLEMLWSFGFSVSWVFFSGGGHMWL